MKKQLLLLLITSIRISFCSAQQNWNVKQCVSYALTHNISVKQQDIQARYDQLTYDQSKLGQYPSLNFTNLSGLNTGRSIDRTTNQFTSQSILYSQFDLQAKVELFNFHRVQNTIAANRYAAEAALSSVEKLKSDIVLQVAGAYLQVLLNRQQREISAVHIQQTTAELSNTRKLVKAGILPQLNEVQLEAQWAQDSANLISALGAETLALLYLKALLNLDAAAPFIIQAFQMEQLPLESISSLQPDAVYRLALMSLPQQQVTSFQIKSAQKSAEAAKAALYPTVSLSANLQTSYSNAKNQSAFIGASISGFSKIGITERTKDSVIVPTRSMQYRYYADRFSNQLSNNFGNSISPGISIPIFNGAAARTNLQRARLRVETYKLQQQQENLTLKQDIYKAYTDAVTALQKFNAATKSLEAAQRAADLASKRYSAGLLNTLELITLRNNLLGVKLQRVLTQYDYVFKIKVLEFYKGNGLQL